MKSPVQAGELEFLVERLCLSTSFDMASAFFEAAMAFEPAKIRLISDFTDTIKTRRFPTPQKAGTLMDPVVNPTPIEQALAAIKDSEDEEPDAPRP
jgi:protein involved in temperature-dependent protein secretion